MAVREFYFSLRVKRSGEKTIKVISPYVPGLDSFEFQLERNVARLESKGKSKLGRKFTLVFAGNQMSV